MNKGKESKPHIGIFGRRNNGKSSLINALTGEDIAIVSEIAGTTTDPVKKSMEIKGVGPAILIDTAGIDDMGTLGQKRIGKTLQTLQIIEAAILVISENQFGPPEVSLLQEFSNLDIPFLVVHNKCDQETIHADLKEKIHNQYQCPVLDFSCRTSNRDFLLHEISLLIPESAYKQKSLLGDMIHQGDVVLLITPIDTEAPEGRMILPQVQVIRDVLDNRAVVLIAQEDAIETLLLKASPRPVLAITDSQVFKKANAAVPADIPLTSFSILLARHKGDFNGYLKGTPAISRLKDGDTVLIMESCTHHVSCDDIGRIKLPGWLEKFTGADLRFEILAGKDQPLLPPDQYSLVIQCGGCMFTRRQLLNRLKPFSKAGIPVTNYGMAIAWIHGIYKRAITPFQDHL